MSMIFQAQVCACQNKQEKKTLRWGDSPFFFIIFSVYETFRYQKIPGITVIKCDEQAVSFAQRS